MRLYQGSIIWPFLSVLISPLAVMVCVFMDVPVQKFVAFVVGTLRIAMVKEGMKDD